MTCQALDHGEVLSIRWAHDDPNPIAKQSIEMADKDAVVNLLQAQGVSMTPAAFAYPTEYQVPALKSVPEEEGGEWLEQSPELNYPNTDAQYASTTSTVAAAPGSVDASVANSEYAAYYADYYAKLSEYQKLGVAGDATSGAATSTSSADTSSTGSSNAKGGNEDAQQTVGKKRAIGDESSEGAAGAASAEWSAHSDPASGATYYFNTNTGESSWTPPAAYKVSKK
jgi:hypothetical protein